MHFDEAGSDSARLVPGASTRNADNDARPKPRGRAQVLTDVVADQILRVQEP